MVKRKKPKKRKPFKKTKKIILGLLITGLTFLSFNFFTNSKRYESKKNSAVQTVQITDFSNLSLLEKNILMSAEKIGLKLRKNVNYSFFNDSEAITIYFQKDSFEQEENQKKILNALGNEFKKRNIHVSRVGLDMLIQEISSRKTYERKIELKKIQKRRNYFWKEFEHSFKNTLVQNIEDTLIVKRIKNSHAFFKSVFSELYNLQLEFYSEQYLDYSYFLKSPVFSLIKNVENKRKINFLDFLLKAEKIQESVQAFYKKNIYDYSLKRLFSSFSKYYELELNNIKNKAKELESGLASHWLADVKKNLSKGKVEKIKGMLSELLEAETGYWIESILNQGSGVLIIVADGKYINTYKKQAEANKLSYLILDN